jgi:hypothetical protein
MTVFPLVVSWFLTFGYVPQMTDSVNGRSTGIDNNRVATVAQIGLSASTEDELFTIYTDMQNFQYAPDGNGGKFKPFSIDYSIGFQIKPNDNIRFNIEHECDHPVQNKTMTAGDYRYGSNLTTITVTLSGKTKLFGGE